MSKFLIGLLGVSFVWNEGGGGAKLECPLVVECSDVPRHPLLGGGAF